MMIDTTMTCPKCRSLRWVDKGWYWECSKCGYTVEVTRTISFENLIKEADHEELT